MIRFFSVLHFCLLGRKEKPSVSHGPRPFLAKRGAPGWMGQKEQLTNRKICIQIRHNSILRPAHKKETRDETSSKAVRRNFDAHLPRKTTPVYLIILLYVQWIRKKKRNKQAASNEVRNWCSLLMPHHAAGQENTQGGITMFYDSSSVALSL
jgi:hypothetical protein